MYQENKELWILSENATVERSVVLVIATTYHFLRSIISMAEDVKNGEKIVKGYMTAYLMVREKFQTLKCCVEYVMQKITSFVKTILMETGSLLFGSNTDVIVQRYVDYTGNENIIKNGEPIIWKKIQK